jgi:outer membrane protein OmpA-like peptidoglycan-associated protein
MLYSKLKKAKILASFIAMLAVSVLAGEGNINYYGQLGVHKTQSAQTLGHGRFGLGFFAEGAGLDIIKDDTFHKTNCIETDPNCSFSFSDYIGVNGYPFLSLGLSDYFDFSVSIPAYGEYLMPVGYEDNDNLHASGPGNLFISSKIRVPFGDEFPLDFALLLGFGISTGKQNNGAISAYGPWVRDPMFLNVNDTNYTIRAGEGNPASTYTNVNNFMKFGVAATLDFGRMKAELPLLFHLNYAYRMPLGQQVESYPAVQSISAALEFTPVEFISLFGEFYNDMPTQWPKNGSKTDLSTISLGTSFHLSEKVDLQIGAQIFIGDENKYIDSLSINLSAQDEMALYSARLIPKYMAFGGLTVKLFVIEQEEEEEYRNPDTDGDGVCDPWVTETGRQREFARICTGLDLCPYEPGPIENKGCPINEAEPIVLFTASPDLVEIGQTVTLNWQTTNATEVTIEGIGTVPESGTRKVKPTESTTYTITATGEGGSKTISVDVEVASGPVPTIIFTASPDIVQKGGTVNLNWQTTNATEVSIEGIGTVPATGTRKVKPTENTTYTLTATGVGGTQTATAEVEIAAGPVPVIMFSANPETVVTGHPVKLNWQVTNATDISIDNGVGVVQAKGTKQVKPEQSTVYTLTATGEGGTVTSMVEVEITQPPPIQAKVNLKGVNFVSGKAELTLNAKQVLDGVAEQLLEAANAKVKIEIHGHTDNVGNPKANQELSEKRAKAVVGYLASKGVKTSRMNAVGFGQDAPIADNKTADGREVNRRIEMIRVDD